MPASHVFVDESKAQGYVLVAVHIQSGQMESSRRTIRQLQLPGQPRLHMKKERDSRKVHILKAIRELQLHVQVLQSRNPRQSDKERRALCMKKLISSFAVSEVERLCLERDSTLVGFDRQILIEATRENNIRNLAYWHDSAISEPLLSIPDAIAWAWSKGGTWAQACGPVELTDIT